MQLPDKGLRKWRILQGGLFPSSLQTDVTCLHLLKVFHFSFPNHLSKEKQKLRLTISQRVPLYMVTILFTHIKESQWK